MSEIILPYKYEPRIYQLPFWEAMDGGCKRAAMIWHRRTGKDKTAISFTGREMMKRVGNYYYYFPTSVDGREILWNGKDKDGFPFLNHIPPELRTNVNKQEMSITLQNGSMFQIKGTDKSNLVGTNPVGCVFSEYSLQDPQAWNYIRPILAENGGWAVFTYTPRGRNHGYELFKMAIANPKWYCQLLTVDDTHAIPMEAIEDDRAEGMPEELVQQEYYCSFEGGLVGAIYGREMTRARAEGRICSVPVDESVPVYTFWDLGMNDSMVIWFVQFVGREIHLVDYHEQSNHQGFKEFAQLLKDKDYLYEGHYAPHDIGAREIATGMKRIDIAREVGIDFETVPMTELLYGINATRPLFSRCYFDEEKCARGIDCLDNYRREYNSKLQRLNDKPVHDWASHGADGFRTMGVAVKQGLVSMPGRRGTVVNVSPRQMTADNEYNPLS